MKKILSILTLGIITLANVSYAGTPDQDLIVDLMRERFKQSTPNLIEYDIELNKDWSCIYYNARKGIVPKYDKFRTLFNFKRLADYSHVNTQNFPFKKFGFHEDGHFIGELGDSRLYARKAKEGTLIFEVAGSQYKVNKSYVSVSNSKLAGHAYIYCKVIE